MTWLLCCVMIPASGRRLAKDFAPTGRPFVAIELGECFRTETAIYIRR
jgi:hypothetical protein